MVKAAKRINPLIKKILTNNEEEKFEEECVDLLLDLQKDVYEETLIKNKNLKASEVRRWLNKLHTYQLTEYDRIRDKKTGWYAYKWRAREDNVLKYVKKIISDKIEKLKNEIEFLKTHTYACQCKKYTFEEALSLNFQCPKDNDEIKLVDNSKEIKDIEKKISELENLLKEVSKLKTIYENS